MIERGPRFAPRPLRCLLSRSAVRRTSTAIHDERGHALGTLSCEPSRPMLASGVQSTTSAVTDRAGARPVTAGGLAPADDQERGRVGADAHPRAARAAAQAPSQQ